MDIKNERELALELERCGDYNGCVLHLKKAIDSGDALACIDMILNIKYKSSDYNYSLEAYKLIDDNMFEKYLDIGIMMGSLDCMFYKAREEVMGDGYIDYNPMNALKSFYHLKTVGYEPEYFDDDYGIDEYIEIAKSMIYN